MTEAASAGLAQQPRVDEELEKIRGEGDLALIKVQVERHKIVEADKRLRALRQELKEAKKLAVRAQAPPSTVVSGFESLSAGKSDGELHSLPPKRRIQLEERLKTAVSERMVELQKLRASIDETRRQRLEAMASEKAMLEEKQRIEEDIQRSHKEAEALKETTAALRAEIAQLEQEFDVEKHAFRVEKQCLLEEVNYASRAERTSFTLPQPAHKASVYYSIGKRKSYNRLSKARQMSLEQKIVSFEQKKAVLDRIVEETNVHNIGEFIQRYNDQERAKAKLFARIEAKSAENSTVRDSIAQLADDITRLSGMGDVRSIVHLEQPSELQRLIATDENQIGQLKEDARVFIDALKTLREPIRELHHELFSNQSDDNMFDASNHDLSSLRRLGEIQDRAMQLVLKKVLDETESQVASETLLRLRQYQGRLHGSNTTTTALTSSAGSSSPLQQLRIDPPSVKSKTTSIPDDDDDDDVIEDAANGIVVHSDAYRRKIGAATSQHASIGSGAATSANVHFVATTPPASPARKNAAIALL